MDDQIAASQDAASTAEAKRAIVNRLRRAEGQLAAVTRAVEEDAGCRTVVQRLSAVSKALDRAGFLVISTALEECLADPDNPEGIKPEELQKLFMSLA
ncbi:metal-sensitive transcriptional regulator [Brevibacterium renqingii]|uniref:metal-sensitive transcriptional regulator n=1 Tax=Brevibacterium renqingii TaxID=2776916 RepID=UPI001ADF02F8|nr:metal-sensitive transcriptional regulator [Brevibacterium renqingii]